MKFPNGLKTTSIFTNTVKTTTNYTILVQDNGVYGDATSGNLIFTLPALSSAIDGQFSQRLVIKKIDSSANTITVTGYGTETINGSNTYQLPYKGSFISIQALSAGWEIVGTSDIEPPLTYSDISSINLIGFTPLNGVVTSSDNLGSALQKFQGQINAIPGAAGISAISIPINQTAHGFAVGDVIRYNGSSYIKAQANTLTPTALGIISSVTDLNNFTVTTDGLITSLSGLTPNTTYYLSDTVPGLITTSIPTSIGSATLPILQSITATSGLVGTVNDYAPVDNPNFTGDVTVTGAGTAPTYPSFKFNAFDSVNGYIQNNIQNLSSGNANSCDWVATCDTGTDIVGFIDMGINGSGWSQAYWTVNGPTDGYLYTATSNLAVGTAQAGKNVAFFTGGTLSSNVRMTVSDTGVTIPGSLNVGGLDIKSFAIAMAVALG